MKTEKQPCHVVVFKLKCVQLTSETTYSEAKQSNPVTSCLRSKRSRTSGMKSEVFRIRAARKVGREQKGRRSGVGVGKEGNVSPPPPRSFDLFALAPLFARLECEKAPSHGPISFGSCGNACYAGKLPVSLYHNYMVLLIKWLMATIRFFL